MGVAETALLLGRGRRRRGGGAPFDPGSLVEGTNGYWLRARSHAAGAVTLAAPWSTSAGRAESFVTTQFPLGTEFDTRYRPVAADVSGDRRITFDPAGDGLRGQHLLTTINTSKAAWKEFHGPVGCSYAGIHYFTATNGNLQPYWQTGHAANEIGLEVYVSSGRVNAKVLNGSGTAVVAAFTDVLAIDTLYYVEFWWSQLAGYSLRVNGGALGPSAQTYTGMITGTPSSSDPTYNLCLGGSFANPYPVAGGSTYYLGGGTVEQMIGAGVWTGAELVKLRKYFNALYPGIGIALAGGTPPTDDFAEDGSDPRILFA